MLNCNCGAAGPTCCASPGRLFFRAGSPGKHRHQRGAGALHERGLPHPGRTAPVWSGHRLRTGRMRDAGGASPGGPRPGPESLRLSLEAARRGGGHSRLAAGRARRPGRHAGARGQLRLAARADPELAHRCAGGSQHANPGPAATASATRHADSGLECVRHVSARLHDSGLRAGPRTTCKWACPCRCSIATAAASCPPRDACAARPSRSARCATS